MRDPSALLWLLLAAPVIALYLARPRAREARVGSLLLYRFVSARQAARAPLARIEKVLSLLLHLAALAGIVLALARPTFGPVRPRRVVAVLDGSSSMASRLDGTTRFAKAVLRARALEAELRGEDEIRFVLAGPVPHLLAALDEARLEGGATSLSEALGLARALGPTEIWILSDGSSGAEPLDSSKEAPRDPAVPVYYHRLGSPDDANVGVVALAARAVPGSESEVEVQATLVNASARTVSVQPSFTLDRLPLVALEPFAIGPWSKANLAARRLALPAGGVLGLHVETAGDVLDRDDDAFVVVPPQRRTRVSEPEGTFLRAALEADDSVALVAREPLAGREEADVVLGERFVLGPAEVALVASRLELRDLGVVSPPRVSKVAREHPLLRQVALDDAVFTRVRHVEAPPGWEVLVAAGEVPLVLARERGRERTLVLTFAPEDSDLVLRRAWPLLVANAVSWLRGEVLRESEPPVKAGAVARIACERPVSELRADGVPVPFVQGAGFVTTTSTERPGIYELLSGPRGSSTLEARFAVSLLDEEESHVAARESLGLGEKPAPPPRPTVAAIEPQALLPLLALGVLLLETFAYHRRQVG